MNYIVNSETPSVTYGYLMKAEVSQCARLEELLFAGDGPWSAEAFRAELEQLTTRYIVARRISDGELIGYAGGARLGPDDDPEFEIRTIGVDPDYQGQGIGKELLTRLLVGAEEWSVFLEVRTDNRTAIALYEHYGFEKTGLRRRYYPQSGADAYTMCRLPLSVAHFFEEHSVVD